MNIVKNVLLEAIDMSKIFGLNENNISNAKEYLEYNEFESCFDTLTTLLYEFDIVINKKFYELIDKIAKALKLSEEKYIFMKELIC
nr:MafI family immunity protein [uncultured Chryseobacterium sp.]